MLYELWRQIAATRRGEPALRDAASGRRWTFGELFAAGETRACGAAEIIFPKGHSPEFILDVLGAWREDKIVCPLEPGQSPRAIAKPPSSCVHLKTTSATTGVARLAAFTAEQLAADAENIVATMDLRMDLPNLGVISMAHSYGFSNLVTPLLLHGIPLILAPSPLPEAVRRAAEGERVLALPAVPAMWRAWHDADAIPPNVKLAISAGAPLPLTLEREIFTKHGLKIHNFYGSTECGGIAYDATETPRTDAACVGTPMKNVSLSVADDGCVEVRSRAVAECLLEEGKPSPDLRPPSPIRWERDGVRAVGVFRTSDFAEISGEQVFLRGRAGDQINVAGRKVSPETIERVLLKHPQVSECLVFGVPSSDAERTEEIVAVVVFGRARHSVRAAAGEKSSGAQRTDAPYQTEAQEHESALRQFVLETLPAWQAPRHWWLVKALQTNVRGKVSRAEWRERWLAK